MDSSTLQCVAGAAGILATVGLIGIARDIKRRKAGIELVDPSKDAANEYKQMSKLFILGINPETIGRLFGIGRKR